MKESKNIERLFQEKFKDFEVNPPSDSWNTIEARLNKKEKKKRVIPFWFKTAGIAASLAIGLFIFMNKGSDTNLINNDSNSVNENSISNVEANTKENKFNNQINPTTIKNDGSLDEKLLNNNENVVLENKNSVNSNEANQNTKNAINGTLNKGVVLNKNQKKNNKSSINNNEAFSNQSLVTNNKSQKKSNNKNNKQLSFNENNSNSISENQSLGTNNKSQKKSNNKNNQLFVNGSNFIGKNHSLVTNNKEQDNSVSNKKKKLVEENNNNFTDNNQLVLNNNKEENSLIDKSKVELLNSNNQLNNEIVISENSSGINKTDSLFIENENIIANAVEDSILLALVETKENPLEKLLKEKLEGEDAVEKEKEKRDKWVVSTNASPVYFNSSSKGSAVDEQFKENSKSYENSLSFGLGVEYGISKKFSLKTGVNTLAFNYSTNDVFYTTTLQSVDYNVKTIERNTNGEKIMLANKQAMVNNSNDVENYVQNTIGSLSQNISYIEVPLEVNYKLLDKKFGINLVGGMSTLFLNSNSVSLVSNGTEMEIGKANNLNNIHFSSNVGLGFKYAFWKSFQANFQPMFKYQINTFSNDSGNFKPYFIGLYSGISFSF